MSFTVLLFMLAVASFARSHTVNYVHCLRANDIAIFQEHYHGDITTFTDNTVFYTVSVGGVQVRDGSVTATNAAGAVLNTPQANLPGCLTTPTTWRTGPCGTPNTYNDWGLFTFPKPTCGDVVELTLVQIVGSVNLLDCGGLPAAPITFTFEDSGAPSLVCPPDVNEACDGVVDGLFFNNVNTGSSAADDCSTPEALTVAFTVGGATTRTGFVDASGAFNVGVSSIDWSVTDGAGNVATCQTTVTIAADAGACCTGSDIEVDGRCCPSGTIAVGSNGECCAPGNSLIDDCCYQENLALNFNFEDISGSGTEVTLADNQLSAAIPLSFSFELYGTAYTEFFISSNGFLSFDATHGPGAGGAAESLPGALSNTPLIAMWWGSLNPAAATGSVHFEERGVAPNRYMIVQFTDVPHTGNSDANTFQAKLFEQASSGVELHYVEITVNTPTASLHTIGLQDAAGNGVQRHAAASVPVLATRALNIGVCLSSLASPCNPDVTPPVAACFVSTTTDLAGGAALLAVEDVDNGSGDQCGAVSLSLSQAAFSCPDAGTTPTVTLTVTDSAGNQATCETTTTVTDSGGECAGLCTGTDVTPPTALCRSNVEVVLSAAGIASVTPAELDGGSFDICTSATPTAGGAAFSCADLGTAAAPLTVEDDAGNQASCTATVTVLDSTADVTPCTTNTCIVPTPCAPGEVAITFQSGATSRLCIVFAEDDVFVDGSSVTLVEFRVTVDEAVLGGNSLADLDALLGPATFTTWTESASGAPTTFLLTTASNGGGAVTLSRTGICEFELSVDVPAAGVRRKRQLIDVLSGSSGSSPLGFSTASAGGDPHIVGAQGQRFDFFGKSNAIYTLFSAAQFVVNMKLMAQGPKARFIDVVFVRFRTVTLRFDVGHYKPEKMQARINKQLEGVSDVRVVVGHGRTDIQLCDGHRVAIEQRFDVDISDPKKRKLYHLDVQIEVPGCHNDFGGILGETYRCDGDFKWDRSREESFHIRFGHDVSKDSKFSPSAPCHDNAKEFAGRKIMSGNTGKKNM